jgi:SAM-dependent methyltransferase
MDIGERAASSHERDSLEPSARLAFEQAPRLCRAAGDGTSCAWLHGFWPCLRIAGLAASPDRHAAFYRRALAALGSAPRLLVSGAADQGMLACVLSTLGGARVAVVDTCETPLQLNRWYAGRQGAAIETERASVLQYAPAQAFDAICTHSFFGQFSHAERPRLLAAWHRLLRPGGKVITAHPLRPLDGDQPNRFTPQQERMFLERLAAETPRLAALLNVAPGEVQRLAGDYLRARYGYPLHSREEMAAYFEAAGFELEQLACEQAPADAPAGSGGPGLRNPAVQYAYVIARRR